MRPITLVVSALALAVLIPGLGYAADPKAKEPFTTVGPPSCNAPGRYVLVQHSSIRADQFLLDTCLGRIWRKVSYTDVGADIWQVIPRADSEDELFQWQLEQLSKSNQANK